MADIQLSARALLITSSDIYLDILGAVQFKNRTDVKWHNTFDEYSVVSQVGEGEVPASDLTVGSSETLSGSDSILSVFRAALMSNSWTFVHGTS